MECKTISLFRSARKSSAAGFTLTEFVIAGALAVLVLAALLSFTLMSANNLLMTRNYLVLDAQARNALDRMTSELRQSLSVTNASSNRLTVVHYSGKLLTYAHDSTNRQVTRTFDNKTTVLLPDCDRLAFTLFNGDPQTDTFDLVATMDVADCKAVRVEWDCSKSFIEPRVNAANNTSATIVMRMK